MGKLIVGALLGWVLVAVVLFGWFRFGHPPVAVADSPFPMEKTIVKVPLNARIDREMVKTPPIAVSDENLIAGARIYREQCASCHGLPGLPSSFGGEMYPDAPPLWRQHRNSQVVGVSDDPPGETEWKVANGIRLTGMPSYKNVLSENEIWQVTLLLANADKLPPQVAEMVKQPMPPANSAPVAVAKPAK